jgi:urease accessory protein
MPQRPQHRPARDRRGIPAHRGRSATAPRMLAAAITGGVVWFTGGGTAQAHPHHDHLTGPASLAEGFWHPLLGWDHLLAMVAVGVLAALAPDRRVAWATPLAFVAALIAGGAIGLQTGEIASIGYVIAGSVVVLGALVALTGLRHSWWLPAIAALFGAAHGQAHGAQIPAGARPLGYIIGFVVATATLHATGAITGRLVREADAARWIGGTAIVLAGVVLVAGA